MNSSQDTQSRGASAAKPLFRQAAVDAQRTRDIGQIVLIRPLSFTTIVIGAMLCAASILSFATFAEYTKRTRVMGLLVPQSGLIKVAAPTSGTVVEKLVQEGQLVQTGQVLFVLDTERQLNGPNGSTTTAGSELERVLHERIDSLSKEQAQHDKLLLQQRGQLQSRMNALQAEMQQMEMQIATQKERVASSQAQLKRWQDLTEQKYASEMAVQQKRDEWFEQRNRLLSMEQSKLQLTRERTTIAGDIEQLATRASAEGEQLRRAMHDAEQTAINLQTQRKVVVTAPVAGIASAVMAEAGQFVGSQTLLTLVPQASEFQAHLYAPSRAAGFVEPGQVVRVRYAAFPYQKFGQHNGTVLSVSRSPIASQDLPTPLSNLATQANGEGLYRITVKLDQQFVNAYGKQLPLSVGMQLDADVVQDTRRIVEWMFEPLLSMKGKWV